MIKLKILILLFSIVFSLPLFADHDYKHDQKKEHIYKNLDYLNLTYYQHKEMKEILIDYRKDFKRFYKKKEKKEKKLQELIKEESFDKNEYENIAKEIFEEALELELEVLKDIHSILSSSQKEKFSYYLQEWRVE